MDKDYFKKKSAVQMDGREKTESILELEDYLYKNENSGKSIQQRERIQRIKGWKVINIEKLLELQEDSTAGLTQEQMTYNPRKRTTNE